MQHSNTWVVVLAAGEGKRVRALTHDQDGTSVPKQYWRFDGRRSLLEATLQRARKLAPPDRIVTVVAAQHRAWWLRELHGVPAANVLVQPQNRGTAAGILLPLMHIVRNDPHADVVVLPSDHAVENEHVLADAINSAIAALAHEPGTLVLLGVTPDAPDPEYGWIVPRPGTRSMVPEVAAFIEKPAAARACELYRDGALWNSFMFSANVRTLLGMFAASESELLWTFMESLADSQPADWRLDALYEELPERDFSRHVLQACADRLRVLVVPACGWSDVGTPSRLTTWTRNRPGRISGRWTAPAVVPLVASS